MIEQKMYSNMNPTAQILPVGIFRESGMHKCQRCGDPAYRFPGNRICFWESESFQTAPELVLEVVLQRIYIFLGLKFWI